MNSHVRVYRPVSMKITTARMLASALAALALVFAASSYAAQPHAAAGLAAIDVNDGFADLVSAVKPAVVTIAGERRASTSRQPFGPQTPGFEEFFRRFFNAPPGGPAPKQPPKAHSIGSGFIIDASGLVVTNYHVIEHIDNIEVELDDGTRWPATLKGGDQRSDLALLQITAEGPLPYVKFGDSDAAQVGDWVIAIGNPFGLGGTTTSGIISARGRDIRRDQLTDFIQVDAPINSGNSGGPLFNTRGEVIGINTAIATPTGGNVGIAFAIPASLASRIIAQLRDKGVVNHGFLGVYFQALSAEIAEHLGLEEALGALIAEVVKDSPAEKAGIKAGDVILTYDGRAIKTISNLSKYVALTEQQARVDIEVFRDGKRLTLEVAIGKRAAEKQDSTSPDEVSKSNHLSLSVAALDDANRQKYRLDKNAQGVVIVAVMPGGAAAQQNLRPGDLIKRVGKTPVNSPAEMHTAIDRYLTADKKSVLLLTERHGETRFVVLPIERQD